MFSIHDELIGLDGMRSNQVVCYDSGYRILIDSDGTILDPGTCKKR